MTISDTEHLQTAVHAAPDVGVPADQTATATLAPLPMNGIASKIRRVKIPVCNNLGVAKSVAPMPAVGIMTPVMTRAIRYTDVAHGPQHTADVDAI